jgi:hypothetical protein
MISFMNCTLHQTEAVIIVIKTRATKWITHGAEPFLRSRQLCSHSRTSQYFIEPKGSLQCS